MPSCGCSRHCPRTSSFTSAGAAAASRAHPTLLLTECCHARCCHAAPPPRRAPAAAAAPALTRSRTLLGGKQVVVRGDLWKYSFTRTRFHGVGVGLLRRGAALARTRHSAEPKAERPLFFPERWASVSKFELGDIDNPSNIAIMHFFRFYGQTHACCRPRMGTLTCGTPYLQKT